jgi:hypothetical protein
MRKRENNSGQATVEFALTLLLLLGFVFFYIQTAMIFAWGNYVHYATFMAARAYQAASATEEDQKTRAKNVLTRMVKKSAAIAGVDKLPSIARGVGGDPAGVFIGQGNEFKPFDRDFSWQEGVRYTFKSRLFLIPMGGSQGPNVNSLTLTSESWLSREPTHEECLGDLKDRKGIIDNGC